MNPYSNSMNPMPLLLLSSLFRRTSSGQRLTRCLAIPAPVLYYIANGTGHIMIDQVKYVVKSHKLIYAAPGTPIKFSQQSNDLEVYIIIMRSLAITRRKGAISVNESTPFHGLPLESGLLQVHNPQSILERIQRLLAISSPPIADGFIRNVQFQELLHILIQDAPSVAEKEYVGRGIEQSIEYIHDHYDEKIRLEILSDISGFTPTSYSREFKRVKGHSPIEYLNAYRIEQAKQMLVQPSPTIKEVSIANGFGNEFYFSRMFKREVGISPSHYRQRKNLKVAVASTLRFHEILAQLGTNPVIATNCHKDKTMDQESHKALLMVKLTEIRQAAPDIIICDHYHQPFLEQFKQIAPTVIFNLSMDWRVNYRNLAEVVGREAVAESNLKLHDARVSQAKPIIQQKFGNETITIMRIIHKLIRIQGLANHPLNELIYSDLGLKPGYCVPTNVMNVEFSPDKYPNMDTDHIFLQEHFFHPDDEQIYKSIQKSPDWQSIRAVKSNHIHMTPNWVGLSWSLAGRIQIIEQLVQ
jgi:AraC-like DNA-binding protein